MYLRANCRILELPEVGSCPCCPPEVQPLPLFIVDWFAALRKILPEVFGLPKTADKPRRKLFVTLKASARTSILLNESVEVSFKRDENNGSRQRIVAYFL